MTPSREELAARKNRLWNGGNRVAETPRPSPDLSSTAIAIPIRDPRDDIIKRLQQEVDRLSFRLKKLTREDATPIIVESPIRPIAKAVADYYGISMVEMATRRRDALLVRARQVAMFLAREVTGRTLPQIGRIFVRDHTTVLHACRKIEKQIQHDPVLLEEVLTLRSVLPRMPPA